MRIAVVSFRYSVEVSPLIKGICTYLSQMGHEVDLVVDRLDRDPDFALPGVRLMKLGVVSPLRTGRFTLKGRGGRILGAVVFRLNRWIADLDRRVFSWRLATLRGRYDWVFCAEYIALRIASEAGYDLERCICLACENLSLRANHSVAQVREIIGKTPFYIAQSEERRRDLEAELAISLDCEIVPVSSRPRPEVSPRGLPGQGSVSPRIVFSGYFATWSCLREFLASYRDSEERQRSSLYLHGHSMGTDSYLQEVKQDIARLCLHYTTVDHTYYTDEAHHEFLCQFDIGVALYPVPQDDVECSSNWRNLICSSGKLASYLWAGLAVLTNVQSPMSARPPFLYVSEISPTAIDGAIKRYRAHHLEFRAAALSLADSQYNLDRYLGVIAERMALRPGAR